MSGVYHNVSTNSQMIALGTGGWIPTGDRQTSCYLYREGKEVLILDAGTGLGRLTLDSELLAEAANVTIVLSHFHLDHVEGLGMINDLGIPVTLAGPGEYLYGKPTSVLLSRLLGSPYKTRNPLENARFVELVKGDCEVNGWQMSCRPQFHHPMPSIGIRVGDEFAYVTDTEYDEGSIEFASGVRRLLHEAWDIRSAETGHSSGIDAGRIASAAGVSTLYLIHINPSLVGSEVLAAAKDVFPPTRLPSDGEVLFTDSTVRP